MSPLRLRYAGIAYFDRTRPLQVGEVAPEGIELEYVPFESPSGLFGRMVREAEFEASEMSLSTYLMLRSRGDDRFVAIPVFPSRAFRHSQVYVSARSGIARPADLAGRDVGVHQYQMTAAVWVRAFLEHDYGVPPAQIRWWVGGLREPGYAERLAHEPPPGVAIERIPEDRALEEMLAAGELDALVATFAPEPFRRGEGVERLFSDYRRVEEDYFRRTGLFPIMHTVVVRRDVYEASPWVARSLLEAFDESRRRARARLRHLGTLAVMHPWIADELERVEELLGGDPFVDGLEANLPALRALARYSLEQGLAERELDLRELFAEETLDWEPDSAPGPRV